MKVLQYLVITALFLIVLTIDYFISNYRDSIKYRALNEEIKCLRNENIELGTICNRFKHELNHYKYRYGELHKYPDCCIEDSTKPVTTNIVIRRIKHEKH